MPLAPGSNVVPNVTAPPESDNLQKFIVRCESRALLWQLGDLDWHDAIDLLEQIRLELKLDPDLAQREIARAFAAVSEAP